MKHAVDEILKAAVESQESDVHFTAGLPPQVRKDGRWTETGESALSVEDCEAVASHLLGEKRMRGFLVQQECDVSYSIRGVGRFRVNVFMQRGSISVAVRVLPYSVPDFETLGLPRATMEALCNEPHGIVLICGPAGSGKSTTLAAMVSYINRTQKRHILTIEDPIEFLHSHGKSVVEQREVGTDTRSFEDAMRHVLRQAPDVLLVGEIRDPATVRIALMIAETGHLVLSTIHAGEVAQALSRVVSMFPAELQTEVRAALAMVLRAMIVQQLLPGMQGGGRALAYELMLVDSALRNLIREGKFEQVHSHLQMHQSRGMRTMNASLAALCRQGKISPEVAQAKSADPHELRTLMGQSYRGTI